MNTATWARSAQYDCILPICICMSIAAPTKVSDTKVTRMTEMTIDALRRRPVKASERMRPTS